MRKPKFRIELLQEADIFLSGIPDKARRKIIFNIDLGSRKNDPRLFKKLNENIWVFRTYYAKIHYRLFAFWDRTENEDILVIGTHGIIKKTQKTDKKEMRKAEKPRIQYFKNKT